MFTNFITSANPVIIGVNIIPKDTPAAARNSSKTLTYIFILLAISGTVLPKAPVCLLT